MKFTLKIVIVLLLSGYSVAQSSSQKLMGFWETKEHHLDSSLLFNQQNVVSQSFYFLPQNRFQRSVFCLTENGKTDSLIYLSRYKNQRFKKQLAISNQNKILVNTADYKAIDKFKSVIVFNSDTSFVLMNNLYFKKSVPNVPLLDVPPAVKKKFYLQNTLKQKRTVKVAKEKVIIQIDESNLPGDHLSRMNTTECVFDSINGDSIKITLLSEEIELEHRNKFVGLSTNYYAGSFSSVSKQVALKDILYLNMRNPFRQVLYNTGSIIIGASILTIVASPFCGFNLKGDEKAKVRNAVFSAGITGFAISIPFFIVGKNKKYVLSPAYRTNKNNYWQLKQAE